MTSYVDTCDICQKTKRSFLPKVPLHPIPVETHCFDRLYMDILHPLPQPPDGSEYIVLLVDSLRKWPEALSISYQEGDSTRRFLPDMEQLDQLSGIEVDTLCPNLSQHCVTFSKPIAFTQVLSTLKQTHTANGKTPSLPSLSGLISMNSIPIGQICYLVLTYSSWKFRYFPLSNALWS